MNPTAIDAGFDRWVWLATGVFFVLMALRAWRVETAGPAVSRRGSGRSVKVMTTAVVLSGVVLGGMLFKQGGEQLFQALQAANQNLPAQAPAANPAPAAPAPAPAAGN